LESSRPKLGRMEETPKGGRGPPWAVAPLERERVGGEDGVLVLRTAKVACRLTDRSGDVPLNFVGMTALCKWQYS